MAAHSRPAGYLQASILSAFARTINSLPRQEEELYPTHSLPSPPPPTIPPSPARYPHLPPQKKETHLPLFVTHWDPPNNPLVPGGLLTLSLTQKTSFLDPKFSALVLTTCPKTFFFSHGQTFTHRAEQDNKSPQIPHNLTSHIQGWGVGCIANA